ncbi:hypothetical protein [Gaetbulibacter saemankumensis]|uniref:hypothetical protein n=1 Tax=Gaetbulibacter saemankumensis TaxID=311208 RepID=UPI000486381D|nr:hypothetical protein [Gaetbulibacter saemankumensis]
MKIILTVIISLGLLYTNAALSQKKSKEDTYTPYELLSGYYNEDFQPFKKRNIYIGFAMSLEDKKVENTDEIIQKILNGERANFDLHLKGGYFIGNYAMAGLNINYHQNKFTGDILRDSDTINSHSITRGFALTPFIRSAVPLTSNERLSFFTEFGITFGRSNTLTRDIQNMDEITKKYETDYKFRIGLSPGVTFFAMENFALEVGIDVLGYELNTAQTTINDTEKSRETRNNIDFEINILSLQLGLAYYIGAEKSKKRK